MAGLPGLRYVLPIPRQANWGFLRIAADNSTSAPMFSECPQRQTAFLDGKTQVSGERPFGTDFATLYGVVSGRSYAMRGGPA